MTLEELKKKLKKAENIEITYQELNNNKFIATIKGIINNMEKKLSKSDLILKELKEIKLDITQLKFDVNELKFDVNELKEDVNELKSDVAILKQDMIEVKSDVSQLKIEAIKHGWDIK